MYPSRSFVPFIKSNFSILFLEQMLFIDLAAQNLILNFLVRNLTVIHQIQIRLD